MGSKKELEKLISMQNRSVSLSNRQTDFFCIGLNTKVHMQQQQVQPIG